jgi:geranylgeranyl pyrophosphate synthase
MTDAFQQQLSHWQITVEAALSASLPAETASPQRLHQAMRYSVLGGGKRVRPALMFATALSIGLSEQQVMAAACAVEMIHAYSLIHDDLPAMDDDDLRRGRPSCHKAYDEATAILAGDALQCLAFEVLTTDPHLPESPAVRLQLVKRLAQASGTVGMAGGQALDLAAEGHAADLTTITDIHARKTGALIHASVMMAAACQPALSPTQLAALDEYARAVGLGFQIQDDLLDIEGDPALLGKATGADQALQKLTYPGVVGTTAAKQKVTELHEQALAALTHLSNHPTSGAPLLRGMADWLVRRQY